MLVSWHTWKMTGRQHSSRWPATSSSPHRPVPFLTRSSRTPHTFCQLQLTAQVFFSPTTVPDLAARRASSAEAISRICDTQSDGVTSSAVKVTAWALVDCEQRVSVINLTFEGFLTRHIDGMFDKSVGCMCSWAHRKQLKREDPFKNNTRNLILEGDEPLCLSIFF